MKKYKCKICGHIYDEAKEKIKFEDLPEDWVCPLCGVPKALFELVEETEESEESEETIDNNEENSIKVKISNNNVAIIRNNEKCINCGMCKTTCINKEDMNFEEKSELCVNCGQCVQTCPVKALTPKNDINKLLNAQKEGKILIAYTSPSTRVAFGDIFGLESGSFTQNKLVGFLKQLGFDYVLDTTFAADLTIMEEASELVHRIKNNGKLPMFTSCCPAWVKYAEQFYPEILDNISTCKSPIGMMGMVVQNYFTKIKNIEKKDIFTVAITPCTAKKYEINREEINGTDLVLTLYELEEHIHEKNIKYEDIKEDSFDPILGEGSGAGVIFGNTGGVMEAALRTAYYLITGNNLETKDISFHSVRGYKGLREATIKIEDLELKIAIIDGISNAKKVLEEVKNGTSRYHYIEIMNCIGGCIGGGGQPKINIMKEDEIKNNRIANLYKRDDEQKIRFSHENPDIIKIYKDYLDSPLSELSEELLHTHYIDRSKENKY